MKIVIMVLSLAAALLCVPALQADTIYRWTDEQGVQRFSNHPPPEGIEKFEKIESQPEPSKAEGNVEKRRPGYDRMLQEASHQMQQQEKQRQAKAAEEKRKAEALRQEEIQNERRRLEQQIETIEKRALGPHFSKGMKKAQIDEIKKQIEALGNNQDTAKSQE